MAATSRRVMLAGAAGLVAVTVAGCGAANAPGPSSAAMPGRHATPSPGTDHARHGTAARSVAAHQVATRNAVAAAPAKVGPVATAATSRPAKNPDGPELLPSPAPGVPTGPGTVQATTLDPCAVVTVADAAQVLGGPATRFAPEQEPDDKDEFKACGYRSADHRRTLLVDVAIDQNAVYSFDASWGPGAAGGPMAAVSTRIPNLGDKAYELIFTKHTDGPATRNLGVVSHGVVLELHASSTAGAAAGRAVLVTVARAAVSRLP